MSNVFPQNSEDILLCHSASLKLPDPKGRCEISCWIPPRIMYFFRKKLPFYHLIKVSLQTTTPKWRAFHLLGKAIWECWIPGCHRNAVQQHLGNSRDQHLQALCRSSVIVNSVYHNTLISAFRQQFQALRSLQVVWSLQLLFITKVIRPLYFKFTDQF